jgi:alpha-tubulin suppressor-like RCC1 family protein
MPLNESSSNTTVQYTVSTTRVSDGTVLYWRTTGSVSNSDIVGGNTGSITITNNRAYINVTIIAENVTEGNETLGIAISTGSQNGPTVVSTANSITVNDTSLDPYYALFSTGYNQNGELGLNDRNVYRSSPTQIGSNTNWRVIAAGGPSQQAGFCAGIKTDGTLWLWGNGSYGKLGQNDTVSRSSPTQVGSLTSWSNVVIDRGAQACMAIRTDGTIWTWGNNAYTGMLGHNEGSTFSFTNKSSPTKVGTDTNWSKIGAASGAFAAIKTDGTLWTWGAGQYGRLGLGDTSNRSSPTQVGTNTNWASLNNTAGGYWMGAIKTDGTLWTWGYNAQNQIGSGSPTSRSSPVQQGSGTNWSKLYVGSDHGLGIKTDGTLWGWGNNSRQQLTNSVSNYGTITQIGNSTNWADIGTGQYETVGLKTDGTIWGWGKNTVGALGLNGLNNSYINSPTQIGTGTNWGAVAVGSMTLIRTNSQ